MKMYRVPGTVLKIEKVKEVEKGYLVVAFEDNRFTRFNKDGVRALYGVILFLTAVGTYAAIYIFPYPFSLLVVSSWLGAAAYGILRFYGSIPISKMLVFVSKEGRVYYAEERMVARLRIGIALRRGGAAPRMRETADGDILRLAKGVLLAKNPALLLLMN